MSKEAKRIVAGVVGGLVFWALSAGPPQGMSPPKQPSPGASEALDVESGSNTQALDGDSALAPGGMVLVVPSDTHRTRFAVREGPRTLLEGGVGLAIAPDQNALLVGFLTAAVAFGWLNNPRGWRGWLVPWWAWGFAGGALALWGWHVWCWECSPWNGWTSETVRSAAAWWGGFVVAYSTAVLHQRVCGEYSQERVPAVPPGGGG